MIISIICLLIILFLYFKVVKNPAISSPKWYEILIYFAGICNIWAIIEYLIWGS